jgi:hypothetical protein
MEYSITVKDLTAISPNVGICRPSPCEYSHEGLDAKHYYSGTTMKQVVPS